MKTVIVMNEKDNTGNALDDICANESVFWKTGDGEHILQALENIPFGFKMALRNISYGEAIVKYGEIIGYASAAMRAGECVHVHNVNGGRGRGDLAGEAK